MDDVNLRDRPPATTGDARRVKQQNCLLEHDMRTFGQKARPNAKNRGHNLAVHGQRPGALPLARQKNGAERHAAFAEGLPERTRSAAICLSAYLVGICTIY